MIAQLNQLIADLQVELKEWETIKKPNKVIKALIRERTKILIALQEITLSNIPKR